MAGPEANLWAAVRRNLPKNTLVNRIENKAGGGMPDAHILWEGLPFWVELKVAKGNRALVSPHQIAWHMACYAHGGLSFFLVKDPSASLFYLFSGAMGPDLHEKPINEVQGSRFESLGELFCALRPVLEDHYARALRPAR